MVFFFLYVFSGLLMGLISMIYGFMGLFLGFMGLITRGFNVACVRIFCAEIDYERWPVHWRLHVRVKVVTRPP